MNRQRVIGFDPGLHLTGYGVVDNEGRRPRVVEAGVLRIPEKLSLPNRLKYLYDHVCEILKEHQPGWCAVEDLFSHYEHPRTAILMGHARGVILLAAAEHGLEVTSYLGTCVKKTTTGSGRATKEQMQLAVQTEFALLKPPEPPDVADALAIALCHFQQVLRAG